MSAAPNGLPPLPKPPSEIESAPIELELPGDLMADLKSAATRDGIDLATAVAMCVQLWRYPLPSVVTRAKPRAKRA